MRPEAQALFASALTPADRVLVTGAGGWFGLTIASLLQGAASKAMFLTQRPRTISFGSGSAEAHAWDWRAINDFEPTIVIDCAFILRDHVDSMSLDSYVHANTVLTARLLQLAQLASVHTAVSVSSGAAVHPVDASTVDVDVNPYGYLKRQAELAVERVGELTGTNVLVARPWSVTGGLVTRPERYAFSNLILQARTGQVTIQAAHEVWRRYVGVDDFFAVALATARRGADVVDSGGELIEFGPLAERIASVLNTDVEISRPQPSGAPADDYYSTDESWSAACATLGFEAAGLDTQVLDVAAMLTSEAQ